MKVNVLRWGVPALLTVGIGTAAAVASSGAAIPRDLAARSNATLSQMGASWAEVHFSGRDALVSGTAVDRDAITAAIARVAQVSGVRSTTTDAVVAPAADPYIFRAERTSDTLTLRGHYPDEAAHAAILAAAGPGVHDELELASGVPDRASWLASALYGLKHIAEFATGDVALDGLDLSISGTAKSSSAYDDLTQLNAAAPAGVRLASRDVIPAAVSPYEWRAVFDGKTVEVDGFAPDSGLADALAGLSTDTVKVSTSLVLASGAPDGFEATAIALVENLLLLKQGTATISNATAALEGVPAGADATTKVEAAMARLDAKGDLAPPLVAEFYLEARRANELTTLKGYVPDEATQLKLAAGAGIDASAVEVARGAPDRFQSGVDFVLDSLARMSTGEALIRGTAITLQGRADTLDDFEALETTVGRGAPQGLMLAAVEIRPPFASPYLWRAEKASDGGITFSGRVPNAAVRKSLLASAPVLAADTTTFADGVPSNFEATALRGLGLLARLDSGSVGFDGRSWSLDGTASTPEEAASVEAAFRAAGLPAQGWSYNVTAPEAQVAALPEVAPYLFSAAKRNGVLSLSGYLPDEAMKTALADRVGAGGSDDTSLASGAPTGFADAAQAGLEALSALDEGTLALAGANWSLTGNVATTAQRKAIETALASASPVGGWHVTIQAADVAPAVSPFLWSAEKGVDGRIALGGYVPSAELKAFVATRAGTVSSDRTLVGSGEPEGFMTDLLAGLDALSHLQSGRVGFDGSAWTLSGQPGSASEQTAALAALANATESGRAWTHTLENPPAAVEVAEAPEAEPAVAQPSTGEPSVAPATPAAPAATSPASAATPADTAAQVATIAPVTGTAPTSTGLQLCQTEVTAFAGRNAILFQSGSARIADSSVAALDELTGYLRQCPDAAVDVEGYTDTDGNADANLALSVARAEAVVDQLIVRGIEPERLYAVGYGESLPIASNDTAAGRQANRRIGFSIRQPAQ